MKKYYLLIIFLSLSLTVNAQWTQIGNDIDGEAADDRSGISVSLSADGNILAVGALFNDENGSNSGHVRVFENQSDSWVQVGADINGESAGDFSGLIIDLSSNGNIVAIGAYANAGNGSNSGHVRIYEWNGLSWNQLGNDIDGEAINDYSGFGLSLSHDGTIVAIGASLNDGGGTNSGHVRVFKYNGISWTQLGNDIDGVEGSEFSGESVSLSSDGSILAVGAYGNDENATNAGQVRVYNWNGSSWSQLGNDINSFGVSDAFGRKVKLSSNGTVLAVSAMGANLSAGLVRVYNWDGINWSQIGNSVNGEAQNDNFGFGLSLSSNGNILAVGAYANDSGGSNAGKVQIYENQSDTWVQIGSSIIGEASEDRLGSSVSLSSDGSIIAIGAQYNDGNGSNSGHVRIFKNDALTLNVKDYKLLNATIYVQNNQVVCSNKEIELKIYTVLGQEVPNSYLPSGIYFVKAFDTNGTVYSKKVLVY